jgi:hypothetical protein
MAQEVILKIVMLSSEMALSTIIMIIMESTY